jgi:beta-galactosidase
VISRRAFNKLAGLAVASAPARLALPAGPAKPGRNAANENDSGAPWNRYFLGAAYYPEWWPPSEWETDFREMQALGINTVRMGEFAWARYEPAPGKFDFTWMDAAIAVAQRHGIDVLLGTPTASVPPWLYQQHPDVLGANAKGPYTYGGRKGYCTNSANYLNASARIVEALAKHYGQSPGVIGWQLDNEPGFPFECYDPNCEHAFQEWLRKHYGTLEALNHAWNGAFWSNEYSDWSQIHFPVNSAEGGWQPAISLDYRRFFSDSFLDDLRRQAAILRAHSKDQFIFTNWPNMTWSVNVFEATAFLDASAWDNYVSAPGLSDFHHQYISSFHNDFCRCAGPKQRFFCAEQIAYVPPNALNQGLRLQAYMNFAHGSHGQIYFEWRRPLAGNEQFRPSLIKRFDSSINPAKPVFEQIGKEFARLGPLLSNATTRSDIAILYDFTNEFAQGFWSAGVSNEHYDGNAGSHYNGFRLLQRNIDVVPLTADLSRYKLVVAPNLRLVDDASVERLQTYVARGGVLVLNYRAATQNVDVGMKRVLPPGPFSAMAGVTAEAKLDLTEYRQANGQFDSRLEGELGIRFNNSETVFSPQIILESLTLHGAEPIATFRGGRMAGQAAITRNHWQQGWVFYIATDCAENTFFEALAREAGAIAKLDPLIAAPYGVEVSSREDSKAIYYFLLNLTESAHPGIPLPAPMDNLITRESGVRDVSLGPFEVSLLSLQR